MKYLYFLPSNLVNALTLLVLVQTGLILSNPASAQLDDLLIAKDLAYHHKYAEADALFNLIIARDGDNMDALLGRAYNHSWNDHLDKARLDFLHILEKDPENKDGLIGLGYTLAWEELYDDAKEPFLSAQQLYPGDPDVEKGLAYVYLWERRPVMAREMFRRLHDADPANTEYYIALAYAHLQLYETREARELLAHALALIPDNSEVLSLQQSLKKATPLMEIDLWAGYSDVHENSNFGLRSVGLSVQASQKLRPFLIYDNTLSLDNLGFLLNNHSANTYYAGTIYSWSTKQTSRLQLGYRDFIDANDGAVVLAEHNFIFTERAIGKIGVLYANNVDNTSAWMFYGGTHLPLNEHWSVEPVYYITRQAPGTSIEHRVSGLLQYQTRYGLECSVGGFIGSANGVSETRSGTAYGAHSLLILPVHRSVWLQGIVKYEHGLPDNLFVASAGIKLRIEK